MLAAKLTKDLSISCKLRLKSHYLDMVLNYLDTTFFDFRKGLCFLTIKNLSLQNNLTN